MISAAPRKRHRRWLAAFMAQTLLSGMAWSAESERALFIANFDLLNLTHQTTETKTGPARNKLVTRESKSSALGTSQLAVLAGRWGIVANVVPESGAGGLVGAGYSLFKGQYLGLAYKVSNTEFSDRTPSLRQEFFGMFGYHLMSFDEKSKASLMWALGPTHVESLQETQFDTTATARSQGVFANLNLRYVYEFRDNFSWSPALKVTVQSFDVESVGTKSEVQIIRTDLVPIAIQLQL